MLESEKTTTPLVSVIIPFLNASPYLNETIGSVVAQQYTNWEIILIDDGSADESLEIATKWMQENKSRIFVFQHSNKENRGAAASRNLGVSKAKGKVLAFLDADDLWLPNYLKEQIKVLQKHPEATVICEGTKYWYSWADPKQKDQIIYIGAPVENLYNPPYLAKKLYPLSKGDSFCTCALMLYTETFKKLQGFDERFTGNNQLFEDQVLFLKICLQEKVYLSSNCNNIYRQRPNSLMHGLVANGDYNKAKLFFLQWLQNYVRAHKIKNIQLQVLIYNAFLPYKLPYADKVIQFIKRVLKKGIRIVKNWKAKLK